MQGYDEQRHDGRWFLQHDAAKAWQCDSEGEAKVDAPVANAAPAENSANQTETSGTEEYSDKH